MRKRENFRLNDYVVFIDDVITGKIIHIDKDQITIESDEGFIYKCQPEEIIHRKDLDHLINNDEIVKKEKNGKPNKATKRSGQNSFIEIDLHIHQLIDSTKGMSNFEILTVQLNKARQTLKHAMKNNIRSVIFIHGVGEGILKKELIKMLQKYPVEISEANYHKYGIGATEAYIFQNYKEF